MKVNNVYKDIRQKKANTLRLVKKGFGYQIYCRNENDYLFVYKEGCVAYDNFPIGNRMSIRNAKWDILESEWVEVAPLLRTIGELGRMPREQELEIIEGITEVQLATISRAKILHEVKQPLRALIKVIKWKQGRKLKELLLEAKNLVGVY